MTQDATSLVIMRLTSQWRLSESQYRCLLALDPAAVPHLLKIDNTLHHLFAASPALAPLWMTSPNRALSNLTPMEVIEQEGMSGVQRVVALLCLDDLADIDRE